MVEKNPRKVLPVAGEPRLVSVAFRYRLRLGPVFAIGFAACRPDLEGSTYGRPAMAQEVSVYGNKSNNFFLENPFGTN